MKEDIKKTRKLNDFAMRSNRLPWAWSRTTDETITARKVSVFGVLLDCIFFHLDWIRTDTLHLSVFSLIAGNTGQNNSEYGHFVRSEY